MSVALIFCKNDFDAKGALTCDGVLTELRINRIAGRFLSSTPFGYWNDKLSAADNDPMRDGANSPHMEIGKCSPL
jgi:hypothetical protein